MTEKCRICDSENVASPIELRETMFGTGEPFLYERCFECGCLQIDKQPTDIAKHYPNNYYSYAAGSGGFVDGVKRKTQIILSLHGPAWLFAGRDWWELGVRKSIRDMGLSRSARILDVGCGNGNLIASLAEVGFRNVLGADPFIPHDIVHSNGARVLKCEANVVEGQFDVVMMHHSLEHIWDQHGTIAEVARLVKTGGRCLIRIPTIDCWAWEEYGRDWIALDPPRHFYIHSRASITRLLESAGFRLDRVVDDASLLQILGSEKIKRGQPLLNPKTGKTDYDEFLPKELIQSASARSRELNLAGRGDSIAVHAWKP
jgi:2-polyprenyl-3-methyl-5-hydroxy-6-metoxy-1,4-benzoquinol methylase